MVYVVHKRPIHETENCKIIVLFNSSSVAKQLQIMYV